MHRIAESVVSNMEDSTSASSIELTNPSYKFPTQFFHLSMILISFIILFLIILVKSRTIGDYRTHRILIIYTVFITTFELSRIMTATLYRNSMDRISSLASNKIDALGKPYEPTITFVIPCKNESAAITRTVEMCLAADYPKEKVEVIVVNDGSTDDTGKILRKLNKKYSRLRVVHWRKNRGKRHGMAAGFKLAKGEIIIQIDSDSYIVPSTIRAFIEPFSLDEIGAICAHADPENADYNLLTRMQAAYYFMSFRILKSAESVFMTVFCCSGCSSAYRRSTVLPIIDEWLDETFLGLPVTWGDDRALTNWVIRRGYKTIYSDQGKAYTICPISLKQFLKQQVRWKKGWLVNSIFASKFIYKERPFVAFTYFFPLVMITILTPFIAAKALLYNPLAHNSFPYYYFLGVFLIACLLTIYYRIVSRRNKYWKYLFLWSALNMFLISFILFYAVATIQNRKWGTR